MTHPKGPERQALRLLTLGETALQRPDGQLVLGPSKQLALLVYVACAPGRSATRSQLVRLLWAQDRPAGSESGPLRTALSRLGTTLGRSVIKADATHVTLTANITSDHDDFVRAVQAGDPATALDLYRGSFVNELAHPTTAEFEHWAEVERGRLQYLYLHTAEGYFGCLLDEGRRPEALSVARMVQSRVPDAELGWRMVLEALAGSSQMEAIAEAEAFERWARSAGRPPEAATAAVLASLRARTPTEAPDDATAGLVAELVGRHAEFAELTGAWRRVGRGPSPLIHITARAGLGKTRLLADLADRLRAQSHRVVELHAVAAERAIPFAFASHLALGLGRLPGAPGVSPQFPPVLVALQPALGDVYHAAVPAPASPDLANQRLLAVAELLAAVTDNQPVALLLDDLHWADAASRELIGALVSRLENRRVMVVTAARLMSFAEAPPEATDLTLRPLSVGEVEELVESMATLPGAEWAAAFPPALHRAAGGSPLLVLESLRFAIDQGQLELAGGEWLSPEPGALLDSLARTNALDRRVQAAGADVAAALLALAVAATALDETELGVATTLPAGRLTGALSQAERAGYATPVGPAWCLSHDEIGRAALAWAAPADRVAVHSALGRLFAAASGTAPLRMQQAAEHLIAAGDEPGLVPLLARWIARERRAGRRVALPIHAADLLQAAATADRVQRLVAALPAGLRLERWRPHALAAGLAALALAGVAGYLNRDPLPVDAYLTAVIGHPDSGALELRRVAISESRVANVRSIDLPASSRVGRWTEASGLYGLHADVNAAGDIAYTRLMPDSGGLDVFVRAPSGVVRRLTTTPGDDIDADWSPDGPRLVFGTARWSPVDRPRLDLAVIDLATGDVRQLTSGPDSDASPLWAPIGAVVAFARFGTEGGIHRCWTTPDGAALHCRPAAEGGELLGWRRGRVVIGRQGGTTLEWDIELDSLQSAGADRPPIGWLDPTGRWLVGRRLGTGPMFLVDLQRNGWSRPVATTGPTPRFYFWTPAAPDPRAIDQLRIGPVDWLYPRTTHHLSLVAFDGAGRAVGLPERALTWTSRDTGIVRINSATAVAHPGRPGQAWIVASAGGWRTDSALATVAASDPTLLHREDWSDPSLARWGMQGDPTPVVVRDAEDRPALLINGDGVFVSGTYSLDHFNARAGLAMVAAVSTPVTRDRWQRIRLGLLPGPAATQGGISGAGGGPCDVSVPGGEGEGADFVGLAGPAGGGRIPIWPELLTGAWYTAVLQIFPDGTCGVALAGRPLWRSEPAPSLDLSYHLMTQGQSVGTRVLLGPIEVWRGIYPGIDWSALEAGRPPGPT